MSKSKISRRQMGGIIGLTAMTFFNSTKKARQQAKRKRVGPQEKKLTSLYDGKLWNTRQ